MPNSPSSSPDRKTLVSKLLKLGSEPVDATKGLLNRGDVTAIAAIVLGSVTLIGIEKLLEEPKEGKNDAPVVVPMEDGQNQKRVLSDDLPAVHPQPESQSS